MIQTQTFCALHHIWSENGWRGFVDEKGHILATQSDQGTLQNNDNQTKLFHLKRPEPIFQYNYDVNDKHSLCSNSMYCVYNVSFLLLFGSFIYAQDWIKILSGMKSF